MNIKTCTCHKSGLLIIVITLSLIAGFSSFSCAKDEVVEKAKVYEQTAATLVYKGDWAGAIVEYSKAIELNPKSDIAYEGRGNVYTTMKNFDLAIADLTRAIELRPDRGGPYYGRGIAYRLQGNLDNAIADLSKAIGDRSKTRWRSALYERGLAYKAQGNLSEAKADFERIVQLEIERPGEADKIWAERAQKELGELSR